MTLPVGTGTPDFGTNEAFRGQQWGAFPFNMPPPPFWALVNSDGTIHASSGNLTITTGSTGIYVLQPVDSKGNDLKLVENQCLPMAIARGGPAPFFPGYVFGTGAHSDGVELQWFNAAAAGVPVNTAFVFMMWLSN